MLDAARREYLEDKEKIKEQEEIIDGFEEALESILCNLGWTKSKTTGLWNFKTRYQFMTIFEAVEVVSTTDNN